MGNKWKKLIYFLMLTLFKIGYFGIPVGIILAFCSLEEPQNKTLGVIGCGIGFGGAALALIIGKLTEKIEDHFGPLYEPESIIETLSDENETPSLDENPKDQIENPDNIKIFTKIGWIISIAAAIVMIGGIFFAYFGNKADDDKHSLATFGILIAVAPVLILTAMALLPEKMRGVKKKPRRERALEILIILSILMTFGGMFSIAGILVFVPGKKGLSIAAICAFAGGLAAIELMPIYRRVTNKYTLKIEVFPSDKEAEKSAYNAPNKMGVADTVLDEEQEREMKRIDKQNRQSGNALMTKEQVEEHEDRKPFR